MVTGRHQPRRLAMQGGRDRERGVQPPARASGCRSRAAGDHHAHADCSTAIRISSRMAACSSSARRRPATQIADEIQRSGRPVTLAVGEHVRVPRIYRGRDIQWWMDASRRARRALRRGRRHRPGPQRAVAAARGLSRAPDDRPQRADRDRREARRPPRRHQRRQGAVLGLAAQPCARWPTSS